MYIVSGWYKLATWGAIFASTLKLRPSNGCKDKSLWPISCFGTKQIWINKFFTCHLWCKALYVSGEKHRNRYNWLHDVLSTLTWKISPFPGFQISTLFYYGCHQTPVWLGKPWGWWGCFVGRFYLVMWHVFRHSNISSPKSKKLYIIIENGYYKDAEPKVLSTQ